MTSFWSPKWPKFDHFHQKWPILTKLTPLMTFLIEFLPINLTEIIFRNYKGKIIWQFLQILTYDVIFVPKMTQCAQFSQKMTYFDQIYAINDIFFTTFVSKNLIEIIFRNLNIIWPLSKISTYDVILAPKIGQNDLILKFSPKMNYFDEIDSINDNFHQKMTYFDQIYTFNHIFDQISVHKPDWNNFQKLLEIKLFD